MMAAPANAGVRGLPRGVRITHDDLFPAAFGEVLEGVGSRTRGKIVAHVGLGQLSRHGQGLKCVCCRRRDTREM